MKRRFVLTAFLFITLLFNVPLGQTATLTLTKDTPLSVYFSPKGGCTEAIVNGIDQAKTEILVQAYSFTSATIAKALVDASKRGVNVQAILDKSQRTEKYSSATFLTIAWIPTYIDDKHAIAHNKIMILDKVTVITGSFNFTKAAEEKNAENVLIIMDKALAMVYIENSENTENILTPSN